MSHAKFQIVFGEDDEAEMHMLVEGEMRRTRVDLAEVPFAPAALQSADVRASLEAWMAAARAPVWMSWADVEDALSAQGIAVEDLVERFPPRFLRNLL